MGARTMTGFARLQGRTFCARRSGLDREKTALRQRSLRHRKNGHSATSRDGHTDLPDLDFRRSFPLDR